MSLEAFNPTTSPAQYYKNFETRVNNIVNDVNEVISEPSSKSGADKIDRVNRKIKELIGSGKLNKIQAQLLKLQETLTICKSEIALNSKLSAETMKSTRASLKILKDDLAKSKSDIETEQKTALDKYQSGVKQAADLKKQFCEDVMNIKVVDQIDKINQLPVIADKIRKGFKDKILNKEEALKLWKDAIYKMVNLPEHTEFIGYAAKTAARFLQGQAYSSVYSAEARLLAFDLEPEPSSQKLDLCKHVIELHQMSREFISDATYRVSQAQNPILDPFEGQENIVDLESPRYEPIQTKIQERSEQLQAKLNAAAKKLLQEVSVEDLRLLFYNAESSPPIAYNLSQAIRASGFETDEQVSKATKLVEFLEKPH